MSRRAACRCGEGTQPRSSLTVSTGGVLALSATTAALRGAVVEGRADGRWPRRWEVDADELAAAASGALRLPDDASSDALAEWLGLAIPDSPGLIVCQPATTGSIVALARREELPVPGEVREFLEVTDGVLVGDWGGSLDC